MSTEFDYSVVIPCFNAGAVIHRAVESVFAQSIQPGEVIVVDDGSTDGTSDAIERRWGARVRLIRQANSGPSAARNRGVAECRTEWVAFLDADDCWVANKIERQSALILSAPKIALAASGVLIHDTGVEDAEIRLPDRLDRQSLLRALRLRTTLTLSSVVVRRAVFQELGGFNVDLVCGEDRELWTRIVAHYPVGGVREPLVHKYEYSNSLSHNPDRTIRDGLIVNRYVDELLKNDDAGGFWDKWTGLRRADAELYGGAAWLYRLKQMDQQALSTLLRSLRLWPFDSPRRMRSRFSALARLLAARF